MKRLFIITTLTILIFGKGFSQNSSSAYDPYVAATFDFLNNNSFVPLQLEDTSGRILNTSSFAGKTIYVDFWFTSCPPCLKEIPYSKSLQKFFSSDTNIVFLNICIDNIDRKHAWKKIVHDKELQGIHLFYVRNRPQKINLITKYHITFPTYMLVNKNMKVIGYNAPRPSEEGWVHWAIAQAENNNFLSDSYRQLIDQSKNYRAFINHNWEIITSIQQ